jgi:hypothetical protein
MPAASLADDRLQFPNALPTARQRRVTSRRVWLRALPPPVDPALLDNANDNPPPPPPFSRPPAKRHLGLKALLGWTYRLQRAHQILREPRDWFLWAMDAAGYIDVPHDRRQLHHDAALVHEAVLGLGTDVAALVIELAVTGMWPEPDEDIEPLPCPIEPPDKYELFGRGIRADGTRFIYWKKIAETVSIPLEEWEPAGRRKMRPAKITSWQKVPVIYCPVRWDPEPEFVQADKRRAATWVGAARSLTAPLSSADFISTVFDHANDNERIPDNDNDEAPAACPASSGAVGAAGVR